jgi:LuxR family maltose regulon positive regulatory protein
LYNSKLRLLLYQARAENDATNLRRGIELADLVLAAATEGRFLLVMLEALLLRAQLRAILGNSQQDEAGELTAADYRQALELAEPEGIVSVFVEQGPPVAEALTKLLDQNRLADVQAAYGRRIITLAQAQPRARHAAPAAREELVEPLTERELDVLRLIAEGLKYKEIAGSLFISLNTVRFHVKAIYSKLGVNTRAQAISKARQLHIL